MGKEKKPELYPLGGKRGWYKLSFVGMFDENSLFKSLYGFLMSRNYFVIIKEQTEAIRPSGRIMEYEWQAFRDITFYVKYMIGVEFKIARGAEVLAEERGSKKSRLNAEMEIRIKSAMMKNYNNTFPNTKFGKYLRELYEKYIMKDELKKWEDKLEEESLEFMREVKRLLPAVKQA